MQLKSLKMICFVSTRTTHAPDIQIYREPNKCLDQVNTRSGVWQDDTTNQSNYMFLVACPCRRLLLRRQRHKMKMDVLDIALLCFQMLMSMPPSMFHGHAPANAPTYLAQNASLRVRSQRHPDRAWVFLLFNLTFIHGLHIQQSFIVLSNLLIQLFVSSMRTMLRRYQT